MRIFKHFQRFTMLFALLFAVQMMIIAPSSVQAGSPTLIDPVIATATGSTNGGWIIGGLFISVASIIACAMIVGAEEGREMTLEEALLSGAIPLGCLFREEFGVTPK